MDGTEKLDSMWMCMLFSTPVCVRVCVCVCVRVCVCLCASLDTRLCMGLTTGPMNQQCCLAGLGPARADLIFGADSAWKCAFVPIYCN